MRTGDSFSSQKVGEYRGADHGQQSGHDDGQAAHRALHLADLDGLRRAERVRGGADGYALGERPRPSAAQTATAMTLPRMPVMMIMATVSVT